MKPTRAQLEKALEMACVYYRSKHSLTKSEYRDAIAGDIKYFIRKAKEAK